MSLSPQPGTGATAEGFRPAITRGGLRSTERFAIQGVEFEYGPDSPAGFSRTRPHGGPIGPGQTLRVVWLEDGERKIITRIEALPAPRP